MSFMDNVEGFGAGHARSWDRATARRQFQLSLILLGSLLCAALVLATSLQFQPPMQEGRSALVSRSIDRSALISAPFAGALAPVASRE